MNTINIDYEKFSLIKEKMIIERFNYYYPDGSFKYSQFEKNYTFIIDIFYVNEYGATQRLDYLKSIIKIRKNYISVDLFCLKDKIEEFKLIFNLLDLDKKIALIQSGLHAVDEKDISPFYFLGLKNKILKKYLHKKEFKPTDYSQDYSSYKRSISFTTSTF